MKFVEESRFQPTASGAAKRLSGGVMKLVRIADTLFASFLAAKLFVTREIPFLIEFES